jgi:hypothetical protein
MPEIYLQEHLTKNCTTLYPSQIRTTNIQFKSLPFDILPKGEDGRNWSRSLYERNQRSNGQRIDLSREVFMESLEPIDRYQGKSSWNRYIAYEFPCQRVILESTLTGNAVFFLEGNWKEMIRHSKAELRAEFSNQTDRFTHAQSWQRHAQSFVRHGFGTTSPNRKG